MRLAAAALGGLAVLAAGLVSVDREQVVRSTGVPPPAREAPSGSLLSPVGGRVLFVHEDGEHGARRVMQVAAAGGESRVVARARAGSFVAAANAARDRAALIAVEQQHSHHQQRERLRLLLGAGRFVDGPSGHRARSPAFLPSGAVVYEGAFDSFRDLYLLGVTGEHRKLTDEPSGCFEPAVHPDGEAVAFVSSRSGDPEVYRVPIVAGDGPVRAGQWRRLTWSRGADGAPRWSPDGRTIAFISDRRGVAAVHLMSELGSRPRILAAPAKDVVEQREIRWSPDGEHIAFIEASKQRSRLRVVRITDGRDVLSRGGGYSDQTPAWSPDGSQLVFASNERGDTDLHRVELGTGAVTQLTILRGADWLPVWLVD